MQTVQSCSCLELSMYLPKIVNEYDQEIPQSQTADKPVAVLLQVYEKFTKHVSFIAVYKISTQFRRMPAPYNFIKMLNFFELFVLKFCSCRCLSMVRCLLNNWM